MSKYDYFETTLTEETPLVAALRTLGYVVEVYLQPVPLFGYLGDERPERAQIVIRREHLDSASDDIGFIRENGRFTALLSEYDQRLGFNRKWLKRVHQAYKEQRTLTMARLVRGLRGARRARRGTDDER
jgi:hypothetical protein